MHTHQQGLAQCSCLVTKHRPGEHNHTLTLSHPVCKWCLIEFRLSSSSPASTLTPTHLERRVHSRLLLLLALPKWILSEAPHIVHVRQGWTDFTTMSGSLCSFTVYYLKRGGARGINANYEMAVKQLKEWGKFNLI